LAISSAVFERTRAEWKEQDKSINRLPNIYDYLLSTTATPDMPKKTPAAARKSTKILNTC